MIPPPTEIYTLPLHDALPISRPAVARLRHKQDRIANTLHIDTVTRHPVFFRQSHCLAPSGHEYLRFRHGPPRFPRGPRATPLRSEEHTSELQSPCNLVCRLLL